MAQQKIDSLIENENHITKEVQFYTVYPKGSNPKRFKLCLRSSEQISIPYSLLPIIMLVDHSILYIKAYELLITITGRNLEPLEDMLSTERVKTISESLTGTDTGDEDLFIQNITVEGKAVEKFVEP